jgi:hypothetical protein
MTLNALLFLAAAVIFVLVAAGVTAGHLDAVRLVAAGLALLAAGHVAWR